MLTGVPIKKKLSEKNYISNKKSECNQFLNWGKLGTTTKKNT